MFNINWKSEDYIMKAWLQNRALEAKANLDKVDRIKNKNGEREMEPYSNILNE